MTDPITTEDLYGASSGNTGNSTPPDGQTVQNPPVSVDPEPVQTNPLHEEPTVSVSTPPEPEKFHDLPVEETPEILPENPPPPPPNEPHFSPPPRVPPASPVPKKTGSGGKTLGIIILFIIIFVLGVWLSSVVKQYIPNNFNFGRSPTPTAAVGSSGTPSPVVPSDPLVSWKSYDVESGTTRLPFGGVSYKLPPDVLSPICDGTNCASVGTYLAGGTRFTVAPRGAGQGLPDFRGTIISDVGGIAFTTKPTTVAGLPATEFTGTFTGRTVSGYAFSKMRGVMIALSPTQSLEINHFTPNGIVADFDSDDTLFNTILSTITITDATSKGALIPTVSVTPTAKTTPTKAPAATGSAY